MDVRRMRINAPCPGCGQDTLHYTAIELDVPYFKGILQTVISCESCGFRHADVVAGQTREPVRVVMTVRSAKDLAARVVRSTSCTVRIPEFGVLVEPGPASEAYVSNIEGILVRAEQVIELLSRDAEDEAARAEAAKRLETLAGAREGKVPFTLILEDPYGNSLVASPKARREAIPAEEAERLARGEIVFDVPRPEPKGNGA